MLPQFIREGISLTAGVFFRSVCTISQLLSTPWILHTPSLWHASLLASPASSQNTVSQWMPNTTQIGAISFFLSAKEMADGKSTCQDFADALIIDRYLELVNNSCKAMEIFALCILL